MKFRARKKNLREDDQPIFLVSQGKDVVYSPSILRYRRNSANDHTPPRLQRVILIPTHSLRTYIRRRKDEDRTRQLRPIRPRPLRPGISLRGPGQRTQSLPQRQRRNGAGHGDRILGNRRLGRLRGLRPALKRGAEVPAERGAQRRWGGHHRAVMIRERIVGGNWASRGSLFCVECRADWGSLGCDRLCAARCGDEYCLTPPVSGGLIQRRSHQFLHPVSGT